MSDNVMVTKLIDEAKKIVSDVETLRNRNGSDFNIFSVLGVENKEVRICMLLLTIGFVRNQSEIFVR